MHIKNRTSYIWLAVAVVLASAILLSFFDFPSGKSNPSAGIVLPGDEQSGVDVDLDRYNANIELLESVSINNTNIKKLISAMHRPNEYHISVSSTVYYTGGQSTSGTEAYVSGDMSRNILFDDAGTALKHSILSGEDVYLWGEGMSSYYKGVAGGFSEDDYLRIPTYESVLDIDDEDILSSDFSVYNDIYCVSVETLDMLSGYINRYYISVQHGLLVGAQSFENDNLVYSITAQVDEYPEEAAWVFTLPDGKVLDNE